MSRDHSDVTNADQQPIYSSVHDTDDVHAHHPQHAPHESSPAAAAEAPGSLSKYVHETPI